ncbi:MAG TPA: Ada metal-binding domain-containing protein, partial [Pyrinomonadaceae bacterium]
MPVGGNIMDRDEHLIRELHALEEDIYWQAVLERDARFNGIFIYGVRSTGIYCKPSCPARRP